MVPGADGGVHGDRVHDRPAAGRAARRRKWVLAAGIAGVLGLLVYFKYAAFVGAQRRSTSSTCSRGRGLPGFRSFVNGSSCRSASASTRSKRSRTWSTSTAATSACRAQPAPLRVLHLVLPAPDRGPDRAVRELGPQLRASTASTPTAWSRAAALHPRPRQEGADRRRARARRRPSTSHTPARSGFTTAWVGDVGFGFQIYFDFSAYSDMALGLARIFGIELPWNFDRPYRSASPTEFWRRWHVTLSTWLRDYLYIPLGGNRKGERRRDVNLSRRWGSAASGTARRSISWRGVCTTAGSSSGTATVASRAAAAAAARGRASRSCSSMIGWVFFRMRPHTRSARRLRRDARPARRRRRAAGQLLALPRGLPRRSCGACPKSGAGGSRVGPAARRRRRRSCSPSPLLRQLEPPLHLLPVLMRRLIVLFGSLLAGVIAARRRSTGGSTHSPTTTEVTSSRRRLRRTASSRRLSWEIERGRTSNSTSSAAARRARSSSARAGSGSSARDPASAGSPTSGCPE